MAKHPLLGELRHRIRVARRSREPDLEFGYAETMTLIGEVWAHRAQEKDVQWQGDATSEEGTAVTHAFTVRRDPLVNLPDARTYVIHRGQYEALPRRFKVVRVREEDQTGRFITLLCAAEQIDGGGQTTPWVLVTESGQPVAGEL